MTVTFDFGVHGIATADADGKYRGNFFHGVEVSEPEAIRQWLVAEIPQADPNWVYINRLIELAETVL